MTEFRHLTDCLAMASVSWVVRFAYGLLGLALAAVVAFWKVGSHASRYQGEPWPNRSLVILTLPTSGEDIVDERTGTIWDPGSRRALEGPLEGEILDISAGFTSFEDTLTLWPDARIWEGGYHNERGEERLLTSVAHRPNALEPVSGLWAVEKAGTPAPIG